ncbi:MAG: hypothetical protein HYY86_03805 [Candidatus Harrisonbacteria bacterium]|nr:hypothetical protein [Candidatus Harrisonbacteria bacterium]
MQAYLDQNQTMKQRRNFRIKLYFSIFFILLLLIALLYILRYSPVFQARDFHILGSQQLSQEVILATLKPLVLNNRWEEFLGWQNLIVWNQNRLDLGGTALLEAKIDRDWLRQSVNISIKERERLAIWCGINNYCYWIDQSGIAFEEAPLTEGSLILTIHNNSESAVLGAKIAEDRFIKNLISVLEGISELRLPVKKIVFDKRLQEIQVAVYSGPDLFFSIRFDPSLNLSSLRSLREKGELQKAKYIDLRVENRIYYKNL